MWTQNSVLAGTNVDGGYDARRVSFGRHSLSLSKDSWVEGALVVASSVGSGEIGEVAIVSVHFFTRANLFGSVHSICFVYFSLSLQ
jgi:hypothetical protein